jgi:hypothetical protein
LAISGVESVLDIEEVSVLLCDLFNQYSIALAAVFFFTLDGAVVTQHQRQQEQQLQANQHHDRGQFGSEVLIWEGF